jgi:N-methylhydantoinase A
VAGARHQFRFSIDMRHRGQINEVEVDLDGGVLTQAGLEQLRERFVARYERLYGHGAALRGARLEMVTFRCRASATSIKPRLVATDQLTQVIADDACTGTRDIYWAEWKRLEPTPIFNGYKLKPGNAIVGPCVVETTTTSMVVHPRQRIEMDALGNFLIDPNWV